MENATSGSDWSDSELDLIVKTYFAILDGAATAPRGFKAELKRDLDRQIGRGIGSIDFKLGNLSFIATQIGIPAVPGFAPAPKAQKGPIYRAFDRYVSLNPQVLADSAYLAPPTDASESGGETSAASPPEVIIPTDNAPPLRGEALDGRPPDLDRLIRKFDPAERDHRNRVLGRLGEHYVLRHERARLLDASRDDLAAQVEWTSNIKGDGAGYDIRSFRADGSELLIEVKTTKGNATTDFFLTRTEMEVAQARADDWRLYRLHSIAFEPRLFILGVPLESAVRLAPESWRARF